MGERRRLPVLDNKPPPPPNHEGDEEDDDDASRPPWHWVGFGVVAIFAAWLPLAYVAGAASARVMSARFGTDASKDAIALAIDAMSAGERARLMATVALPNILALAMASFGGGYVVGRWGTGTGRREAVLAGIITALIASILAWSGLSVPSLLAVVVTILVAVLGAACGGRIGAKRRVG